MLYRLIAVYGAHKQQFIRFEHAFLMNGLEERHAAHELMYYGSRPKTVRDIAEVLAVDVPPNAVPYIDGKKASWDDPVFLDDNRLEWRDRAARGLVSPAKRRKKTRAGTVQVDPKRQRVKLGGTWYEISNPTAFLAVHELIKAKGYERSSTDVRAAIWKVHPDPNDVPDKLRWGKHVIAKVPKEIARHIEVLEGRGARWLETPKREQGRRRVSEPLVVTEPEVSPLSAQCKC
jgi:hypothetical protein